MCAVILEGRPVTISTLGGSRSLSAVFTPIKSGALVDEVCRRIELAVESGLLRSGQRLPNESEMALALGVSAVTTREALSHLRGQGLIRTTRGRSGGSFVTENAGPSASAAQARLKSFTRAELIDLGDHYRTITVACAGLAAERSTPEDIPELRRYIRPITAAGEAPTAYLWRLAVSEFLLATASTARSPRLVRELMALQADVGAMTLAPFENNAVGEMIAAHNEALTDAIEAHDVETAEALSKESTRGAMAALLAQYDALF